MLNLCQYVKTAILKCDFDFMEKVTGKQIWLSRAGRNWHRFAWPDSSGHKWKTNGLRTPRDIEVELDTKGQIHAAQPSECQTKWWAWPWFPDTLWFGKRGPFNWKLLNESKFLLSAHIWGPWRSHRAPKISGHDGIFRKDSKNSTRSGSQGLQKTALKGRLDKFKSGKFNWDGL